MVGVGVLCDRRSLPVLGLAGDGLFLVRLGTIMDGLQAIYYYTLLYMLLDLSNIIFIYSTILPFYYFYYSQDSSKIQPPIS